MTVKLRHWPGEAEGVGHPPESVFFHFLSPRFTSPHSIKELVDACVATWPANSQDNTLVFTGFGDGGLGAGNAADYFMVHSGGNPPVTIAKLEDMVRTKMSYYRIWAGHIRESLRRIKELGFGVSHISIDVEWGQLGLTSTIDTVDVVDVVSSIYNSADWQEDGMIPIDLGSAELSNIFGNQEGRIAYAQWTYFVETMKAAIWEEVISDPAKEIFGSSCRVFQYQWAVFRHFPWNMHSTLQRNSLTIDGSSNPVLYSYGSADGTGQQAFRNMDQLLNQFYAVDPDSGPIIPWVQNPDRYIGDQLEYPLSWWTSLGTPEDKGDGRLYWNYSGGQAGGNGTSYPAYDYPADYPTTPPPYDPLYTEDPNDANAYWLQKYPWWGSPDDIQDILDFGESEMGITDAMVF